jgi:Spy/CpxP family protein refolding chaperone
MSNDGKVKNEKYAAIEFSVGDIFPNGLHPGMLIYLNLTDLQIEQIRQAQNMMEAEVQPFREKLEVVQAQLKSEIEAEDFNELEVRLNFTRKAFLLIELEIIRLRADAGVYKLLTAEQRRQLEQLKKERPEFPC